VLLLGGERKGLSSELQGLGHVVVRIPMLGHTDSLNLSVAASLLLYEVFNQRRRGASPAVTHDARQGDTPPVQAKRQAGPVRLTRATANEVRDGRDLVGVGGKRERGCPLRSSAGVAGSAG
jgi:tRNA C32,U32 (ribose-2'-O)-methylase TrmJ